MHLISSRSVYSVALWRRTPPPKVCLFWTVACCGVASWQRSEKWTRLHKKTTTNLSPIQRYQNRFCTQTPSWWNRAHKLRRSKRDGQTFEKRNPRATKLDMVIEDLWQVLAPLKLSGRWKFGETGLLKLKFPYLRNPLRKFIPIK